MMKPKDIIPSGPYCYTWLEYPSKENNFRGKVKHCPYYKHEDTCGVTTYYCEYLNIRDMGNCTTEEYHKILKDKFNNDKNKMWKYFTCDPGLLLFDDVKECSINLSDEVEYL